MKKSTKKNDKTIFIAAAIMFACAIGLFVGAFARFQTVVGGSATLKTADWSFMVNGGIADFSYIFDNGLLFQTSFNYFYSYEIKTCSLSLCVGYGFGGKK